MSTNASPAETQAPSPARPLGLDTQLHSGWINLTKHRALYLGLSALLLLPGLYFMALNIQQTPYHAPLKLGIDFVGGTLIEYGVNHSVTGKELKTIRQTLDAQGFGGSTIQVRNPESAMQKEAIEQPPDVAAGPTTIPADTKELSPKAGSNANPEQIGEPPANAEQGIDPVTPAETGRVEDILSIRTKPMTGAQFDKLQSQLTDQLGTLTLLQKNAIGPTLASELLKNGVYALVLAYLLIMGYLTLRFQLDYAICAMLALVHDSVFVFGFFAMLGALFGTEIDALFVTAVLTVVGFSVHDTIVVFDRLRENSRLLYSRKVPFIQIADISVHQTLARSINTSLTALLPLLALYFFGGSTIKDFVLCMIVGIVVGTFSSIFIASLLLTWWRGRNEKPVALSASDAPTTEASASDEQKQLTSV